jgi:hypothetical protein
MSPSGLEMGTIWAHRPAIYGRGRSSGMIGLAVELRGVISWSSTNRAPYGSGMAVNKLADVLRPA